MGQSFLDKEGISSHAFVHDVLCVMRPGIALTPVADPLEPERRTPEPRQRTLIQATIKGRNLPEQDAIIRNISPHGMCLAPQVAMPENGDEVSIKLPSSLRIQGQVCWYDSKQFGIQLEHMLDLQELMDSTHRRNANVGDAIDLMVERHFHLQKKFGDRPLRPL